MTASCENCGGIDGKHAAWCYHNGKPYADQPIRAAMTADDPVNRPAHYTAGNIECIDYMQDVLTPDEFRGYLRGQVIKYQHRLMAKGNPAQDAAKLAWYANRLVQVL